MAPEENPPNDPHALPDPPSVPAINRQRHENRHSALRRTPSAGEHLALPRLPPHRGRLRERLLVQLDADLLVDQLIEQLAQLRDVIEQARPRVRLASDLTKRSLRDPRALASRQAEVRNARLGSVQVAEVARDQGDGTALHDARDNHNVAAGGLDRRRAPLPPPIRRHLHTIELSPHPLIIAAGADGPELPSHHRPLTRPTSPFGR